MKMKSDEIIEKIRAKLKESDNSKRSCFYIFQFHFKDVDDNLMKSIVFDLKELSIYEGKIENADAVVTISDDDFYKAGCKLLTLDDLLNQKKVQVEGDLEAFKQFVEKFRMHASKSP